jgi:large subunit ribosomal protein L24
MHVRKGDTVIVIAGNDKGATGEVSQVLVKQNRVIVEGVNLRWKNKRPTQQSPQGERVQEECPIHASNVMRYDPETKKGTRKRKAEA